MKKGIIFLVIFTIIITFILYNLQTFQVQKDNEGKNYIKKISLESNIDINTFINLYKLGEFEKIELINGTELIGYKLNSSKDLGNFTMIQDSIIEKDYNIFKSNKPIDTPIGDLGIMLTGSIPINVKFQESSMLKKVFLEQMLPLILFIIIIIVLLKMFGPKGGAGGFPFGAQAGKLRIKGEVKTTFKDVAGMEESKQELEEIVDYLKNPTKYVKAGARVPRGALLYGPPGSGKTLLARAVAGEAGVAFFSASGSEFMEMLVGMGAAKVRELFNKAKAASPSIIFIDEIDTIGKKRGQGYTGGHQEQEQTLNQILTEMDGFEKETNVIIIAATNRPDILDPALLRPGRFDRKVFVGRPTLEERVMILKLHIKGKKIDQDVDLETFARRTSGFVGADLENIVNEATLKSAKEGRQTVNQDDFEYALEKVVMGPEKKIKTLKDKERLIVTYHELGHALCAYYSKDADPVEKISIVSRGMALGVTWTMPREDSYLYSKNKFMDELVVLLGGRAAEEIYFGFDEITTGASNDFEKATAIANDMIMKYGMDKDLGTIVYYDSAKNEWTPFKPFSEKTSEIIDKKVKEIIDSSYKKSKFIIKKNKSTIDKLGKILLEKEYLSKEEFEMIIKNPENCDKIIEDLKAKKDKKIEKIINQDIDLDKNQEGQDKNKPNDDEKESFKQKLENILDKFLPKKNK